METIILAKKGKTVREIGRLLDARVLYENSNDTRTLEKEIALLIRWGSTQPCLASFERELNKRQAILLSSDKKRCREHLAKSGIPVPEESETDYPVIGRRTHHTQGRGFFVCRNAFEVQRAKRYGCTYFSKFYPKRNEYRVHVGSNKVLAFSEKLGDKTRFIWNKKKNGFTFKYIKRSIWLSDPFLMDIQRLAKKAIEAVGLDFGAVDIMANPKDTSMPTMVVSEINTCPSLSPLLIRKYSEYFGSREEVNEE